MVEVAADELEASVEVDCDAVAVAVPERMITLREEVELVDEADTEVLVSVAV